MTWLRAVVAALLVGALSGCSSVVNQYLAEQARRHSDSLMAVSQQRWDSTARARKATSDSLELVRVATIRSRTWPRDITQDLIEKKVHVGMTTDMVRLAWGQPDRVNQTVTAYSTDEQWVYGSSYLYFTAGTLTAMQVSH